MPDVSKPIAADNPPVLDAWRICPGDPDYPILCPGSDASASLTLYGIGNRAILCERFVALICSVQCPGSVIIKTFDAIRELRDAGIVVAGGFHSPMESECLDFLLRGKQPIVVCPAKGLQKLPLSSSWRDALDASRLLVLSPFDDDITQTTASQAQQRNELVASLARVIFVPHASPGGKTEALARQVLARALALFTLDDPENANLLHLGAQPYSLDAVRESLSRSGGFRPPPRLST